MFDLHENKLHSIMLLILFFLIGCNNSNKKNERPNVLFIAIDDMNDWIGPLGGNSMSKTPNLDKLAKRSVVFTNAHCTSPACSPSRLSVITS